MGSNCRFAFAIHVMSVMALHRDEVFTSARLARTVNTNPVVIRRLLQELQAAGLVQTRRGSYGGAWLIREPHELSVTEILAAVDEAKPFADHPQQPAQECVVGRRIQAVMDDICQRTMHAVQQELSGMTLADIVRQIESSPCPSSEPDGISPKMNSLLRPIFSSSRNVLTSIELNSGNL